MLAATQGRKPASQQTCAAEALAATDLVWVCERFFDRVTMSRQQIGMLVCNVSLSLGSKLDLPAKIRTREEGHFSPASG